MAGGLFHRPFVFNEKCIILESTAGKMGYPGMKLIINEEKIAVDSATKEEYPLE